MKLVIAGGTGFLGDVCVNYFREKYNEIIILSRNPKPAKKNTKYVYWDGKTLSDWKIHINNCNVLINLAGRSVDCRYNRKNKKDILSSRIDSTKVLGKAVLECKNPPNIWLNSSTATIYRHSLDVPMDEAKGEKGNDFSMNVAKSWEKTFYSIVTPKTRKIAMRTSIVLGKDGGALIPLKNLAKIGFGGKQGKGNQMVSWIHEHDFARAIEFLIHNTQINGPVNIVSPNRISNKKFMRSVRNSLKSHFGIPIPKLLLEFGAILMRTETELVLKSRNVVPKKLLDSRFEFCYPNIGQALKNLM